MKQMTYEESKKKYVETNKKWKFDLFSIVCKKCGSDKVEFNSDLEVSNGYYGDYEKEGNIIIKCHNCGNAFTLDFWDLRRIKMNKTFCDYCGKETKVEKKLDNKIKRLNKKPIVERELTKDGWGRNIFFFPIPNDSSGGMI